jgi:hypothetical protein
LKKPVKNSFISHLVRSSFKPKMNTKAGTEFIFLLLLWRRLFRLRNVKLCLERAIFSTGWGGGGWGGVEWGVTQWKVHFDVCTVEKPILRVRHRYT